MDKCTQLGKFLIYPNGALKHRRHRSANWPLAGGWENPWFSTSCNIVATIAKHISIFLKTKESKYSHIKMADNNDYYLW